MASSLSATTVLGVDDALRPLGPFDFVANGTHDDLPLSHKRQHPLFSATLAVDGDVFGVSYHSLDYPCRHQVALYDFVLYLFVSALPRVCLSFTAATDNFVRVHLGHAGNQQRRRHPRQ
jgi:hypothetical protein